MADPQTAARLEKALAGAGRAHHGIEEEPGHDWAVWYAGYLVGEIQGILGFSPGSEEVANWLRAADERYRLGSPDGGWPAFYARFILDEIARGRA